MRPSNTSPDMLRSVNCINPPEPAYCVLDQLPYMPIGLCARLDDTVVQPKANMLASASISIADLLISSPSPQGRIAVAASVASGGRKSAAPSAATGLMIGACPSTSRPNQPAAWPTPPRPQ